MKRSREEDSKGEKKRKIIDLTIDDEDDDGEDVESPLFPSNPLSFVDFSGTIFSDSEEEDDDDGDELEKKKKKLREITGNKSIDPKMKKKPKKPPKSGDKKTERIEKRRSKKKQTQERHLLKKKKQKEEREHSLRAKGKLYDEEFIVCFDSNLVSDEKGKELYRVVKLKFPLTRKHTNMIENSIIFGRRLPETFLHASQQSSEESQTDSEDPEYRILNYKTNILIVLKGSVICEMMQIPNKEKGSNFDSFLEKVLEITKADETKFIFIIEGVYEFISKQQSHHYKKASNKRIRLKAGEKLICKMERKTIDIFLHHYQNREERIKFILTKNNEETIDIVLGLVENYAKSFTKKHSGLNLFGQSKKKVDGKKPKSKEEAYVRMLMEIPHVSQAQARAISAEYPSISSLRNEYKSEFMSDREKRSLLVGIKCGNTKIGKSTSRKVFETFNNGDPDFMDWVDEKN